MSVPPSMSMHASDLFSLIENHVLRFSANQACDLTFTTTSGVHPARTTLRISSITARTAFDRAASFGYARDFAPSTCGSVRSIV